MQKKNILTVVIGLIVIIALGTAGFMLFYKHSYMTPTTTSSSSSSSTKQAVTPINNAILTTKSTADIGQYLTNPSGQALYIYGGDSSGVSNCNGSCLANWPAYQATGSTTDLPTNMSTIKRSDNGQTQFTYKGMPLYTFVSDSSGKVTGNGMENFQVATP